MNRLKRIHEEDLPLLLAKIIPYACLFVVVPALFITTALGRPDLASMGLYLAISVILVAVIVIWKPNLLKENMDSAPPGFKLSSNCFSFSLLVFTLLYVVSLYLLIGNESRPLFFFILVASMAGLISIQILTTEPKHSNRRSIILVQIVLLSLNLILGQTLKLPLFWGDIDTLAHLRWINGIAAEGQVISAMGMYYDFPLFHIFQAVGTIVTDMEPKMSSFILHGLSFAVSILIVYLIVSQLTRSSQLPLLAALLYSVNRDVLLDVMPLLSRTMAFFLYLLVLYLLVREKSSIWLRGIAVFLIIPLTLTHHVTLAYISAILALLIVIDLIMHHRSTYIGYTYLFLFAITYTGYWVYVGTTLFRNIVPAIFPETIPITIPSQSSVAIAYAVPVYSYLAKYADYTVIAFLAILGIVSQLSLGTRGQKLGHIFALFSLLALVLYLPTPVAFLQRLILTPRLALLLSPFIVFVAARGISLFFTHKWSVDAQRWKKGALVGLGLFIIVFYTFSSVTILGNWTDFDLSKAVGSENRHYFTEAELDSFSFIAEHRGHVNVYTDYFSFYYLIRYLGTSPVSSDIFATVSREKAYFLLREEELQSKGVLLFTAEIHKGFMGSLYFYRPVVNPSPEPTWEEGNKIYDNHAVAIYG